MLENEKILRFDIITKIRTRMPMCFTADGEFVTSTLTEGNANELRTIIIKNNIDKFIIEDIILGYLFRNDFLTQNFKDQVNLVLDFFFRN
jgi:hypothetical protein